MNYRAHPTAEIDAGAAVGDGTVFWQQCIVLAGARIGEQCKLAHNVFVEGGARIGNRVTVKDNVALYSGVDLEDDVFVGPNAVFTNVLAPRAFISRKHAFIPTRVGRGASIGANATILCGVSVGEFAMIGAGAVVTRDVKPFALVYGNPARQAGWVSRSGIPLDAELRCPETDERYQETDQGLQLRR
ncbi:MAG: N-acetyltransferase [Pseudorhodoplanes sp.]|nr:MAG: N-acetyltransferase [Pseudorhodoplanes sp.]